MLLRFDFKSQSVFHALGLLVFINVNVVYMYNRCQSGLVVRSFVWFGLSVLRVFRILSKVTLSNSYMPFILCMIMIKTPK